MAGEIDRDALRLSTWAGERERATIERGLPVREQQAAMRPIAEAIIRTYLEATLAKAQNEAGDWKALYEATARLADERYDALAKMREALMEIAALDNRGMMKPAKTMRGIAHDALTPAESSAPAPSGAKRNRPRGFQQSRPASSA